MVDSVALTASDTVVAYVCLGANQGDVETTLTQARAALAALPGVTLCAASPVFKTEPQGFTDQPFFSNQVLALRCTAKVQPETLLDAMLSIEVKLGRVRLAPEQGGQRFGPRAIDIDLLLFGNERRKSAHLELPHPRMLERAFVMLPLASIAPDLALPQGGSVREALQRIPYTCDGIIIFQNET